MFLIAWAEKGLLGYREYFYRGNVDMMCIVLSIGLFADELVVEESSYNAGSREIVYDASEKVHTYIISSMQKAFHQTMEKLLTKSQQQESSNLNQLPDFCIIAQEITDLAFTEREIYSPILKSHHPLVVGVAVATLHSCFGQQVKAFVSSITDLTPDVIQVLISADKMEKCLVHMVVQDPLIAKMVESRLFKKRVLTKLKLSLLTWSNLGCKQNFKDLQNWLLETC